jgi:hypothetical protein
MPACPRLIATAILTGCLPPVLFPGPSEAAPDREPVITTTTLTDADDTPGGLDLAAVSHAVREDGPDASLRFTVRLHAPFEASTLHRRHRLIVAELDTDGGSGAERNITVYARHGQVHADLISNATREVVRRLRVRQVSDNAVRVRGPRRLIGARRIFWYSLYHRTGHRSCGWDDGFPITCSDSVPDDKWLRLPPAAWPNR